MRIIDANTGHEVTPGVPFRNVDGVVCVLGVKERLLSAEALVDVDGRVFITPLTVRYTHPGFFLQKVAFIPS